MIDSTGTLRDPLVAALERAAQQDQQSGSATTRRSEPDVSYTVLFVHEGELDGKESWEPLGEMTVPARTQRATVLRRLLEGQTPDGEGGTVPQVPLDAERGGVSRGCVRLVPTAELGDVVPVQVRLVSVFEVVE